MVRHAVGYESRAFVTFSEPIPLAQFDPDSRRDLVTLAHQIQDAIGAQPQSAADGARRLGDAPAHAPQRARRAARRSHAPTSRRPARIWRARPARQAADEGVDPAGGARRPRGRRPQCACGTASCSGITHASIEHLISAIAPDHALGCSDAMLMPSQGRVFGPRLQQRSETHGLALRHAEARQLCAALHCRRIRRRSHRGRADPRTAGPDGDAGSARRKRVVVRGGRGRATRVYAEHGHEIEARGRRPQYFAEAHATRARGRSRHLHGQPAPHPGSRRRRASSSCASTWRTRRSPNRRSRSSTRCGASATGTWASVIQSYLKRSAKDVERLNAMGARVRLVKGAYREPREVAYQQKSEVDAAFVDLMRELLRQGTYPAIASHDPAMIEATRAFADQQRIPRDTFEFQMLYGIRRDLQASLSAEGYPVPRVRAVRQGMVSVLHAAAGRAARQRRLRPAEPVQRRK